MCDVPYRYSYGEQVAGAYHCQFGVAEKDSSPDLKIKPIFMKQMGLTGSVREHLFVVYFTVEDEITVELLTLSGFYTFFKVNGTAEVSFQLSDFETQLQRQRNQTLSQIQQAGSRVYLGVFVTNVKSEALVDVDFL